MIEYPFQDALGAFFLADGRAARALLPQGLHPLEPQPGHAVFALTSFNFHQSVAGPFHELVLSILVPPGTGEDGVRPLAAFFPFAVATSTRASKIHNSEQWYLPAYEPDLNIRIEPGSVHNRLTVHDGDRPVLTLTVGVGRRIHQVRPYQCYTWRDRLHRASVTIEGPVSEHEEEQGRLELFDHPLAQILRGLVEDEVPFREQTMAAGVERFGTLQPHWVRS